MDLLIIDTHALIYRAYYAMEKLHLKNQDGLPIGAIFGIAQYLMKIVNVLKPSYCVAVMDPGGKSHRHEIYPKYKANRSKMPQDLVIQLPVIERMISLFGIKIEKHLGYEADDIIATIVKDCNNSQLQISIISKDKDLMQLIRPNVSMLAPNGTGVFELIDEEYVINKFGVEPCKLNEWLALVGDVNDNIPGVKGIGPKKAAVLINSGDWNPMCYKEYPISLRLTTLNRFRTFNFNVNNFKYNGPMHNGLTHLLTELQFDSILKDIK